MVALRLKNKLIEQDGSAAVRDVRIGLGYTAVQLEDGRTGLAYTFHQQAQGGCTLFHAFRPVAGRKAHELLDLLLSQDPIEAAVGLACANALCNQDRPDMVDGDIMDLLDLRAEDQVAMVGLFEPLVGPLSSKVGRLTIFEKQDRPHPLVRPAKEVWDHLPTCQVAVITSTAIINNTIDELLRAAGHCRAVALVGASTPLMPSIFADTPVTLLSGSVVTDAAAILQVVSEAGGMRFFKNHIRKVNLRV